MARPAGNTTSEYNFRDFLDIFKSFVLRLEPFMPAGKAKKGKRSVVGFKTTTSYGPICEALEKRATYSLTSFPKENIHLKAICLVEIPSGSSLTAASGRSESGAEVLESKDSLRVRRLLVLEPVDSQCPWTPQSDSLTVTGSVRRQNQCP